jgi:hypothetical protein
MCNTQVCGKKIKSFINNFGLEETQNCVLESGHKGRCSYRPDYKIFGEYQGKIKEKISNAALSTAGETANNSPIKNRAYRWSEPPISMNEETRLKKEGKFRVGIRKDEAAPFSNCTKIEKKLYETLKKTFLGIQDETTCCPYCDDQFTFEQFLLNAKNPNSIQICHWEPLSEDEVKHNENNCFWGHRQCNITHGDQNIPDLIQRLKKMVNNLEKRVPKCTNQY